MSRAGPGHCQPALLHLVFPPSDERLLSLIDQLYPVDDEEDEWDEPLLGTALGCQQVQRPRLLICGAEGAGQGHLGPALLYALEGVPVHALGLPSLLSDASARYSYQ